MKKFAFGVVVGTAATAAVAAWILKEMPGSPAPIYGPDDGYCVDVARKYYPGC